MADIENCFYPADIPPTVGPDGLLGNLPLPVVRQERTLGANTTLEWTNTMTLCPIALVTGCQKCPAFKICPLKTVIGDVPKAGLSKPPPPRASRKK